MLAGSVLLLTAISSVTYIAVPSFREEDTFEDSCRTFGISETENDCDPNSSETLLTAGVVSGVSGVVGAGLIYWGIRRMRKRRLPHEGSLTPQASVR
jgi:hypothetical protein